MPATIRAATPDDVGTMLALMYELAEFEKLTHLFIATEDGLRDALFGARPSAEAIVAERDGKMIGYALFFHNYSTFLDGAACISKTCTCSRPSAARGSGRRCCAIWRRWLSSGSAAASNGRCWTGISLPSIFIRRWARPCCRTGASCA